MTERRSAEQLNLKRYMAYRVAAWARLNFSAEQIADKRGGVWKALSERTLIHKSDVSHIRYAESSSEKLARKLSRALGPEPLDSFLVAAQKWAAAFPDWKPGDEIADPLAFVSLSGQGRWTEMAQYMPRPLIRAGEAVQLLEDGAAPEGMIQDAVDMSWLTNKEDPACIAYTVREWQAEIERELKRIRRGSGPRESAPKIKLVDKS